MRINLAEASLTTGRYQDAMRLAREQLTAPVVQADDALNMRFMIYAALALSGADAAGAQKELLANYQRLPRAFRQLGVRRHARVHRTDGTFRGAEGSHLESARHDQRA